MKDYGPEGAAYPVAPGERWTCGSHLFICGSMFDALSVPGPTVVYADPPWNQTALSGFRTKAGLPRAEHSWLDVYRRIIELARGVPCFMEGGLRQQREVADICLGEPAYRAWAITYYRKHPGVLHYCGPPLPPRLDLAGLDDDDTPLGVMMAYPQADAVVLDPCAGRGQTSRMAQAAGWSSVNLEIHPARMSAAMARLAAVTGHEPARRSP